MKLLKSLITSLLILVVICFASSLAIQAKTQTTDKQINIVKDSPGNVASSNIIAEIFTVIIARQSLRTDNFDSSQKIELAERKFTPAITLKPKLNFINHKIVTALIGENDLHLRVALLRRQNMVNKSPHNHYTFNLTQEQRY